MPVALVTIHLLGPWHPGTGRGEGPGADALVNTDAAGLPFLPGRTLKGLLREGARLAVAAGEIEEAQLDRAFGHLGAAQSPEAARYRTVAGGLVVGSARVGQDPVDARAWQGWARGNAAGRDQLFRTFASTRLDEFGVAAQSTLRTVQVALPVPLVAEVGLNPDGGFSRAEALTVLHAAVPNVYALGAHRTRGLGRCVLAVREA